MTKGWIVSRLGQDMYPDRLTTFWRRTVDYLQHTTFTDSGSEHADDWLNYTQALSVAIGFVGVDVESSTRTFILVHHDSETGRYNYQSLAAVDHQRSPLGIELEGKQATIFDHSQDSRVVTRAELHARVGTPNFYYGKVGPDLSPLPVAVIISPYTACTSRCLGCARANVDGFKRPSADYIAEHVKSLADDYDRRGWNRSDLASVSIITGCQSNEEKELAMMLRIMAEYRRQGYDQARFHIFSYNISSEGAMKALLEGGAAGFVGTLETINDMHRVLHWGARKGSVTFEEHMRRFELARSAGFEIIEANYVIGTDSYEEMMYGLESLDASGVAVIPNIKRNYNQSQLDLCHPDIWRNGPEYVYDGFRAALKTYRHGTIKREGARSSIEWLHRNGNPEVTLQDLPIRHT